MAGDWIKMRTRLGEEKSVMLICDMTGLDEFAVVGRLHAIWAWAGEHTVTGDVPDVTLKTVDRVTRTNGFADAMVAARWLESLPNGGIRFTRYKRHNGKSAKQRALAADRQARKRAKMSRTKRDGERDASVTSHAPREEKRREEKRDSSNEESKNPISPFDQFWEAFPSGRKHAKGAARKSWDKAITLASPETIIAAAKEYASSPVGRGEYVKGPSPWLNQECWNDDRSAWQRGSVGGTDRASPRDAGQRFIEGSELGSF